MKRARRLSQRLVRWTSLCVCFALVLSCLAIVPFASVTGKSRVRATRYGTARGSERVDSAPGLDNGNGQGRRVAAPQPQPGPPRAGLPNLDDVRRATPRVPRAPLPIPSRQRRWRHVMPVIRAAAGGGTPPVTVASARNSSRRSSAKSSAVSAFNSSSLTKLHHARSTRPLPRAVLYPGSALAEPQGTSDMAIARIDPRNRTGTGGVDLLSNNFNWSLGLVGLKGRGGLDLGLTLSYNSLATWTQSGIYIDFDQDQGTPSPGFRLGFPVVQGPYYNNLAGANFYLLITPSGQHVELRQISTYVYQSVDASYSQLTVYNNGGYLIFRAGGAELTFSPMSSEYHCIQVKDRNGNYLTINYNSGGDLSTVTDTLGRVITFVYDIYANLKEIEQTWSGQSPPHQW